ncbi:MAG: acyl-homoserine-lactone synthase [Candidatus Aenigmatarchaeota archaeon]
MNKFSSWQKFLSRFGLRKSKEKDIENNLILKERNFVGKILTNKEIEEAYRFRYKVFHEELRWLPLNDEGKDIDKYDKYSVHFGIFHFEKLIAYSRIILPKGPFMLEEIFKDLIPNDYIFRKGKDSAEISRLAIDHQFRIISDSEIIKMLLFKIMYHWSLRNKIRFWYMCIDVGYLKSIQKLFPCKQIGEIKLYQSGTASTAALVDLREAEVLTKKGIQVFMIGLSEYES